MILAIDPGTKRTGWVVIDLELSMPLASGIEDAPYGEDFLLWLSAIEPATHVVIEKPVCQKYSGSDVSETAILTGHIASGLRHCQVTLITRSKVRGVLQTTGGGDSAIINRLWNMFTPGAPNKGKGTKEEPGWFYGFKGDIWQAYALGVTYIAMVKRNSSEDRKYLEKGRLF
jgi:hypothetical protein